MKPKSKPRAATESIFIGCCKKVQLKFAYYEAGVRVEGLFSKYSREIRLGNVFGGRAFRCSVNAVLEVGVGNDSC